MPGSSSKKSAAASSSSSKKTLKLGPAPIAKPSSKPTTTIKKQPPVFEIRRCVIQSGERAGEFSKNHQMRVRTTSYANNSALKQKLNPLLLGERWKWNDEDICHMVRIHSKHQAAELLKAFREHLGADKDQVPETIDECSEWAPDFEDPQINIVKMCLLKRLDRAIVVVTGHTYPMRDVFKNYGFTMEYNFNDVEGRNHWIHEKPDEVDINAIVKDVKEWGWTAEVYDDLED